MPVPPFFTLEYKNQYEELGLQPIPLSPNSKEPIPGHSWKGNDIWNYVEESSNIGLVCGGNAKLVVIDCDNKNNPKTYAYISGYLESLGINNYPLIRTASYVSRHIYLQLLNSPKGSYNLIKPDIGKGEIRFGNSCYVVAPPSVIDDTFQYQLMSGNIAERPLILWKDLLPLVSFSTNEEESEDSIPKRLSRNAKALLFGKNLDKFGSRSEAEQSLVLSCINSGLEFEEILNLFIQYPAGGKFKGKYLHNQKSGIDYLRKCYQSAKWYGENNLSEGREIAIQERNWANSRAWRGNTGLYDKAVFLAHCDIGYQSGKIEYQASLRELAEKSGLSIGGVANANKRLVKNKNLEIIKNSTTTLATVYSLGKSYTLPHSIILWECITLPNHDVFRYQGLGKSGFDIWQAIQQEPKTIAEIQEETGRSRKTIISKLKIMGNLVDMRTGEIVSMITFDDERYSPVNDVDLDYIAELLGTKGMGERQKAKHEQERTEHKAILEKKLDGI